MVSFQACHIRLLTFDIYNTVIRVRGSAPIQYAAVASQHGLNVDVEHLSHVYKNAWKHMKVQYPNYGLNQGLVSKEWWHDFVERVFCAAGYAGENHKLSQIAKSLYVHFLQASTWEEVPEARGVLANLRENGLHLGVISNFDERLGRILEKMDLNKYFEFVVTSVEAKHEKPSPEIFRFALRKAGVEASEAAHVGDDLQTDYFGPRRIGMHSFLLNSAKVLNDDSFKDVERACVIERLSDLESLVKSKNILYV